MAIFSRVIYGTAQIIQFSTADFKGKAWVYLSHTIIFLQVASGNDAKKIRYFRACIWEAFTAARKLPQLTVEKIKGLVQQNC